MSYKILFIFEGQKTEPKIGDCLQHHFFSEDSSIIYSVFGSNIYSLYDVLRRDEHADVFEVLKEQMPSSQGLQDLDSSDIGEIYLFFDHDGHDTRADNSKILNLLATFNNETDNGLLYINYPMVEAIKELEPFKNKVCAISDNRRYKSTFSGTNPYNDLQQISKSNWNEIIVKHLRKANWIVNNDYDLPIKNSVEQFDVYKKQIDDYITPSNCVSILSAFPLFIDNYFKDEQLDYR